MTRCTLATCATTQMQPTPQRPCVRDPRPTPRTKLPKGDRCAAFRALQKQCTMQRGHQPRAATASTARRARRRKAWSGCWRRGRVQGRGCRCSLKGCSLKGSSPPPITAAAIAIAPTATAVPPPHPRSVPSPPPSPPPPSLPPSNGPPPSVPPSSGRRCRVPAACPFGSPFGSPRGKTRRLFGCF